MIGANGMGLDQWAWARKDEQKQEIMYWRKHPNLQDWMEDLYDLQNGEGSLNCIELPLSKENIIDLHKEHRTLANSSGPFWGETTPEKIQQTEEFISKALLLIEDGWQISYYSWW